MAVNPRSDIPVGIIDHFSIGVKDPEERIRSILAREGIEFTEALYVKSQDSAFMQLSESAEVNPSKAVSVYPRTLAVAGIDPVFRPRGLDQVSVSVTNLAQSAGLYRKLCGPEIQRTGSQLVFKIGSATLVVRETRRGQRPQVDDFRVLVDQYDHARAAKRMKALGAGLHLRTAGDGPSFTDPDGIVVYVAEMRPAR